jgi:thioredoxin reductase
VSVVSVSRAGDRLQLRLSNGESDEFDRVVLATGYRIDISKYELIEPATLARVNRTDDGYPILSTGLETSVPGLFMIGAVGERTLGPTLRFVTGTSNAAPRLAAAIAGTSWN